MTARWLNSLGEEVDLERIDKEYALNILTMVLLRRGRQGHTSEDVGADPLVQRLRETVLHGREPDDDDRRRAARYNKANAKAGLPFRAPAEFNSVRDYKAYVNQDAVASRRLDVGPPADGSER